jgi:hypothetical protein
VIADVASVGIPRDGDLRAVYGLFTFTPRGWRVQIRRVRYPVRKATQAITSRRVPGAPLLVHKMLEARYRHHDAMVVAARRHSGLPKLLPFRPSEAKTSAHGPLPVSMNGAVHVDPVQEDAESERIENPGETLAAAPDHEGEL